MSVTASLSNALSDCEEVPLAPAPGVGEEGAFVKPFRQAEHRGGDLDIVVEREHLDRVIGASRGASLARAFASIALTRRTITSSNTPVCVSEKRARRRRRKDR